MSMPTGIGIVDLGTGFPHSSVAEKKATYDFFRANLKDRESLEEMEFPAEYMFKGVPDLVPEGTDVVAWTLAKMGAFGVDIGVAGLTPNGWTPSEKWRRPRLSMTSSAPCAFRPG